MNNIQTVIIPGCVHHEGHYYMKARVKWICPKCGGPRGQIKKAFSFDGSRRLICDGWINPCGHVDKYDSVRKEAISNGLNAEVLMLRSDEIDGRYDQTGFFKPEKVGI
jgi:hypothetical protein